jgi:hypothetical protein
MSHHISIFGISLRLAVIFHWFERLRILDARDIVTCWIMHAVSGGTRGNPHRTLKLLLSLVL